MTQASFNRLLIAAIFATGLSACSALSPTTSPTSAPSPTTMSKSDNPLRNTYWKLVSLHGKPVTTTTQQREAHIVFSAQDNRISGSSGCNRMMGGFEENANHLKFKSLAGTRMACPAGMQQEAEFLQALQTVDRYQIQGERLEVQDAKGTVVASFVAVALQ